MPVTLVRHTRLVVSRDVCYGRSDIEVADTFEEDAKATLAAVTQCDHIVSSPLQRCRRLADKLSQKFNVTPRIDARLAEMDFGQWELVPWSDIPREELDVWADNFLHGRPHGGETVAELRERSRAAAADIADVPGHHLVVCHGGVIRALLSTGDQASDFKTAIPYGGIVPFEFTESDDV